MIPNLAPAWPFTLNLDSPQARGLYAWYPFHFPKGNGVYDFMQVNDGSLTGAPVWTFNDEGAYVLTYDGGATDYVNLGDDPNMGFEHNVTWSAYIRFVHTSSGDRSLIGKWHGGDAAYRRFLFRINTGTPEIFTNGSLSLTGSTSIANNTRYHALITNDGTGAAGGLKLYIADDAGVITDNGTSDQHDGTTANSTGLALGARGGQPLSFDNRGPFVGDIEEFRYHTVDLGAAVFKDIANPKTRWDLRQVEQPKRYFVPAAVGGTTINVPQGNLALSTFAASLGVKLGVPLSNLLLTTVAPQRVIDIPLTPGAANLLLSTEAASLHPALGVPQADLSLSTEVASLHGDMAVPQANLLLSTFAPTATQSLRRDVPQADLSLSTAAPSLDAGMAVPQGNLVLSAFAPTVTVTTPGQIDVPQADLLLTSTAPVLDFELSVPQGSLTLDGKVPGLGHGVAVPQSNLSFSTTAAVLGIGMTPGQANLALSTFAPTLIAPVVRNPGQANLRLSTFAPTITTPSTQPAADKTPVGGGGGGFYGGKRVPETERIKRLMLRWREEAQRAEDLRANLRTMLAGAPPEPEPKLAERKSAPAAQPVEAVEPPGTLTKDQRRRFKRLQRRLRDVAEGVRRLERDIEAAEATAARTAAMMAEEEAAAVVLLLH